MYRVAGQLPEIEKFGLAGQIRIRYLRSQKKSNESSMKEESPEYGEGGEIETIHESRFNDSR